MITTAPNPPRTDVATARRAAEVARKVRAEWLVAVSTGIVSIDDVLREAATESGRPLHKISLQQLLLSQPFVGESRKDEVLRRMSELLHDTGSCFNQVTNPTIGFLLDTRAGGRRYAAFRDARSGPSTPVAGFPFAPLVVSGVRSFVQGGKGQ